MKTILGDPESPLNRQLRVDQADHARRQELQAIDDALAPFQNPGGGTV